jgi:hypothetical protein
VAVDVTMRLDVASEALLKKLSGKHPERVIFSAARRGGSSALRKMRAQAVREVRKVKAVKVAAAKKRIKARNPVNATRLSSLTWSVHVDGHVMPIASFPIRQTRAGVKFKVNKSRWSLFAGAFIADVKSGHRGVFVRAKSGTRRKRYRTKGGERNNKELPIKEQSTSGLASAFRSLGARDNVLEAGAKEFEKTFLRNVQRRL